MMRSFKTPIYGIYLVAALLAYPAFSFGADVQDSHTLKLIEGAKKEGQQTVLAIGRTPARPGIDTKMQAKNLKLFPIPPELGDHYSQHVKEFRELFGR